MTAHPTPGTCYPPHSRPLACADRLIADLFTTADGHRTLAWWRGGWWTYTGGAWQHTDELAIRTRLWTILDTAHVATDDGPRDWAPTTQRIGNLIEPLQIRTRIPDDRNAPTWLTDDVGNPDPTRILPVRNGLLDLTTGTLHPHTPDLFTTWCLPYDHTPTAACPNWAQFLNQIFAHDPTAIRMLQQYAGYLISGRTDMHKALMLIGPTRAGKGIIARTLTHLIGNQNTAAPTLQSLAGEYGLSPLIGKPFAVIADARTNGRTSTAIVERLLNIIGEDAITANIKYQQPWHGTLPTRILLCSNETPWFIDASGAVVGRWLTARLEQSFVGREDHRLETRIRAEMPGILNWALDGLADLNAAGAFTVAATHTDIADELTDIAAPEATFIQETYTITGDPADTIDLKTVYADYRSWAMAAGGHPASQREFTRRIRAANLTGVKPTQRDSPVPGTGKRSRVRVVTGIQQPTIGVPTPNPYRAST